MVTYPTTQDQVQACTALRCHASATLVQYSLVSTGSSSGSKAAKYQLIAGMCSHCTNTGLWDLSASTKTFQLSYTCLPLHPKHAAERLQGLAHACVTMQTMRAVEAGRALPPTPPRPNHHYQCIVTARLDACVQASTPHQQPAAVAAPLCKHTSKLAQAWRKPQPFSTLSCSSCEVQPRGKRSLVLARTAACIATTLDLAQTGQMRQSMGRHQHSEHRRAKQHQAAQQMGLNLGLTTKNMCAQLANHAVLKLRKQMRAVPPF